MCTYTRFTLDALGLFSALALAVSSDPSIIKCGGTAMHSTSIHQARQAEILQL